MNFQIKPKDIQQFLFKLGYMWDGIIIVPCRDDRIMTVEDLNDISSIRSINAFKNNKRVKLNFIVSGEMFQFMIDDLDWDSSISYYDGEDVSEKWKKFLLRKYKANYALFLKERNNIRKINIEAEYVKSKQYFENLLNNLNKETQAKLDKCKNVDDMLKKYIEKVAEK